MSYGLDIVPIHLLKIMTVLAFLPQEHLLLIIVNGFECESRRAILMKLRQFECIFDRLLSFPSYRLSACIQIGKKLRVFPALRSVST